MHRFCDELQQDNANVYPADPEFVAMDLDVKIWLVFQPRLNLLLQPSKWRRRQRHWLDCSTISGL